MDYALSIRSIITIDFFSTKRSFVKIYSLSRVLYFLNLIFCQLWVSLSILTSPFRELHQCGFIGCRTNLAQICHPDYCRMYSIEHCIFHLNILEEIYYRFMDEWDPAINDFVLRCKSCWKTNKYIKIIHTSREKYHCEKCLNIYNNLCHC